MLQWLPTYKGVVAGSVVAGFGMGAMVFNPVITTFINPNNTSPEYAPYPDHPSEKFVNFQINSFENFVIFLSFFFS